LHFGVDPRVVLDLQQDEVMILNGVVNRAIKFREEANDHLANKIANEVIRRIN
jgi:hypothetical protein